MRKCDIHRWQRYELRDEDGAIYFIGYRCAWCREPGYVLDLEESSRDPLNAARGILTGLFFGAALWTVLIAAWAVLVR
jgi:hypothetical protein